MPICQRSLYSDHLECTPYASLIVFADVHPAKISSECIRKSLLATAKVDMSIRTHGTYHTNLFALSGNFLICHNDSIQQLQILGQAHQNINIATFDASVQLFLCVRVKQKVSLLPYTASSLSATIHPNVRVSSIYQRSLPMPTFMVGGGGEYIIWLLLRIVMTWQKRRQPLCCLFHILYLKTKFFYCEFCVWTPPYHFNYLCRVNVKFMMVVIFQDRSSILLWPSAWLESDRMRGKKWPYKLLKKSIVKLRDV